MSITLVFSEFYYSYIWLYRESQKINVGCFHVFLYSCFLRPYHYSTTRGTSELMLAVFMFSCILVFYDSTGGSFDVIDTLWTDVKTLFPIEKLLFGSSHHVKVIISLEK
jgi:hypothetical protein